MALYLSMDGVDDKFVSPQVTVTKIVMEFLYLDNPTATTGYYMFDNRGGSPSGNYMVYVTGGASLGKGSGITSLLLDGVAVSSTAAVAANQRYRIEATFPLMTSEANGIDFFINYANQNTTRTKGNVYRATGYNGGTVVFDYDMTTGTVNDQSGNGRHATLTGGTWLDDGAGGGTAYTKSLSDSVSFTDAISKSLSVAVVDTVITSESENEQATKALSDSIAITDTIAKALSKFHSDSVNTSETDSETVTKELLDSLTQTDSITTTKGKAVVLSDSLSVVDSISKAVSRLQVDSVTFTETFTKQSAQSVRLYDVVVTTDTLSIFNPNAPDLIGVIRLKGSRDLYIYLNGSRELTIHLKGGINMTVVNPTQAMTAGDTKNLEFAVDEDLTGSTAKFVLKKKVYSTENEILKTTSDGITVSSTDVTIELNPSDTVNLAGTYYYECEVIDQQTNVSTIATGHLTISKSGI